MRSFVRNGIVCAIILALIGVSFASVSMNENNKDLTEKTPPDPVKDDTVIDDAEILEEYSQLSGDFTENRGQIENSDVKYYIKGSGVWLLEDGVVFDIQEYEETNDIQDDLDVDKLSIEGMNELINRKGVVLKLNFENANNVEPTGQNLLMQKSNFFFGEDPDESFTDIFTYNEIAYNNIYDNIDIIFKNTEVGLKYDFIVHPGGNPEDIRLNYEGANDLGIDSNGEINIYTESGVVKDSKLYIYQDSPQGKNQIEGNFKIQDSMTYGFEITGAYDSMADLIIDPLVYSTFVGGKRHEVGTDIEVDSHKNAYVTGYTLSEDFPTTFGAYDTTYNGNYDVFVFKLNAAGSALIYSTYVGGKNNDLGYGIEINEHNEAFVTGATLSKNFPVTPGAYDTSFNGLYDSFVFKLKSGGDGLVYSTFVGAKKHDVGLDIAIDKEDNAYVTGYTQSQNFPTIAGSYDTSFNGVFDVFVYKLKWTGANLIYSTYVGGNEREAGFGITLDSDLNAYVTGYTLSTNFPTTTGAYDTTHNGFFDVFVFELRDSGATLIYSTYVGGNSHDAGLDIVLDSDRNAYVTGFTLSINFPVPASAYDPTHNGGFDVFVFKLKHTSASTLIYSTFVGGNSHEWGWGIDIDTNRNVYVTGFTYSSNFPVTPGAYDTTINGWYDVFVFILNKDGTILLYSTFVGGYLTEWGYGIAIDSLTDAYVTGLTGSGNFPTTVGAYDTTINGGYDVFVFKLRFPAISPATLGDPDYWVLGQYPRHTWMDLTTLSKTGATVRFWGTTTIGGLKQNLGSINLPAPEGRYQSPKKISRNIGEFFSDTTSDTSWLTGEWYYLEMRSNQPFMVVFSRSVILEGSHVTHSDQILSKPPTSQATDWWFTNGGSLARDDKIVIYSDQNNIEVKFKERVIKDHYPVAGGTPQDKQLGGYSSEIFTGLHVVDAKDVMNNIGRKYSFHSHACFDYAIGVFDRFFHSDDGDPLPLVANSSSEYNSKYYHGWYGLTTQKSRFIEIKDRRIYAEQPAEQLWGIYTPNNKIQYEDINGVSHNVGYASHTDDIHRDTVQNTDVSLYASGAIPRYIDLENVPGGLPFASDLPAADEVIAHRATYFGYDPVVAKLQIANPYDCDVIIVVLNKQNLRRTLFSVPAHSISVKDLYYDATFENFFDPISSMNMNVSGIPDHAFVIEVGAFMTKQPINTNITPSHSLTQVSDATSKAPKVTQVDIFQKVTDTLMLRQYNRVLLGTYDGQPCPESDEPSNCTVATPKIKPDGGCFDEAVNVVIVTSTPNATIYYTTDGSEPTESSTKYTGPFVLNETTTVKAKAFLDGCKPSDTVKVKFTKKEKVATPVITPNGGYFNSWVNVTITCSTPNATIYYTLNGSEPNEYSMIYTGSFGLNTNATVKARAYKDGCWIPSDTAAANFMIGNFKNGS